MSDLLVDALGYAERGLSVIPTKGKRPTIRTWKPYAVTPATSRQLRKWYASKRPDGIAVIAGDVSGSLVCRDFDERESYERWASEHPDLAEVLPTVETARGFHIYFQNGCRRIIQLGDGELRGAGYSLLPPSRHPSGSVYRWKIPLTDSSLQAIDPFAIGLATPVVESVTERTEEIEETEEIEAIVGRGVCGAISRAEVLAAFSVSQTDSAAIAIAIEATQPTRERQRNFAVFRFSRHLKGIPALADADPRSLEPLVRLWHRRALPVIGTKPFDDTWAEFIYGWSRVKWPKGSGPMADILAKTDAAPLPEVAMKYECPMTHRLIKLCRELQRASGDGPFFLSCRTAADLLDMGHPMTAHRRLYLLEFDDIIRTVEPGTRTRATRYRYIPPV